MKALTIKEIKQLKEDEWVYIVNLEDSEKTGYYKFVEFRPITTYFYTHIVDGKFSIICISTSAYGDTWLAYKNKEQAECKGELVELICKLDDTIYVPWKFDGVSSIAELQVVYIEINKLHNNYVTNLGETIDMDNLKEFRYYQRMHHGVYSEQDFNKVWFKDKKLAEQKLKELLGKNERKDRC